MATDKKIRSYSYTFASDETGLQREFFSGGSAHYADISYAIDAGKTLQVLHGEEKLGFPASYSTYIYSSETNTLLVYTRCMRQVIAGRVISCGQVIVYNLKDMLNGEECMRALFGTRFLSEAEILRSGEMKYAEVVRENEEYRPVRLTSLSEKRKETLAAVVFRLMSGKQVVLRLPVSRQYEAQSMEVLQQIMTLIPQRDRCEISFATACAESDVKSLRRVNLILTNADEEENTFADWIDLDAPPPLGEGEKKWLLWCNEAEDIRSDVERASYFSDKEYTSEVPRRALDADRKFLEDFYEPGNLWWQTAAKPAFSSVTEIREELRDNPTLSAKRYRSEFLSNGKLQQLITEPGDLAVLESLDWVSEETKEYYRRNRLKLLLTDEIWGSKVGSIFKDKAGEAQNWRPQYYERFCEELVRPFYADPAKGIVTEGEADGVSYTEIVRELRDRIGSYRNI